MATQAAKSKGARKPRHVVTLDADKLGFVAGAVVATIVMAICFYWREMDFSATAVRVGWTFVAAYATVFFLVRVFLRTTITEFVQHTREKRARRRRQDKAESKPDTQTETQAETLTTA